MTSMSITHLHCMTACMHPTFTASLASVLNVAPDYNVRNLAVHVQQTSVSPGCPAASSACMGQWSCGRCSLQAKARPPPPPVPPLLQTPCQHILHRAGLPLIEYAGALAPLSHLQLSHWL